MTPEEQVREGQNAILAKMRADRPTLRAYLKTMQQVAGKSDKEWAAAGSVENSLFARGQWYAYRDIERMMERDGFKPE